MVIPVVRGPEPSLGGAQESVGSLSPRLMLSNISAGSIQFVIGCLTWSGGAPVLHGSSAVNVLT